MSEPANQVAIRDESVPFAYDMAKQALALALTVDEAKTIHDDAERLRFYARQANDRDLMADAMALMMRARRRIGELLAKAKEAGQLSRGGRPRAPDKAAGKTGSGPEQVSRGGLPVVTLKQAGIDRKLSMEAQKLAAYDEHDFEAVIEKGRERIRSGGAVVINPVKDLSTHEKKLHRAVREAQLAAQQKALPQRKFGVILADPEWQFETWSEAGKGRAADNHYPTSTDDVIAARPVGELAADDCVLFLWTPASRIDRALRVMAAWGFEFKSLIVWDKVVAGNGFWFRDRAEILLVGTRGQVPAPAMGTQWENLVSAPKTAHSEKPDWAYDLIEAYFPNLPKIELNARRRRDGWDAWGFEAPDDEQSNLSAPRSGEDADRFGGPTIPEDPPLDRVGVTPALDSSDPSESRSESNDGQGRADARKAEPDGVSSRPSRAGGSPASSSSVWGRAEGARLAHNQEVAGSSPAPATSLAADEGTSADVGGGAVVGGSGLRPAADEDGEGDGVPEKNAPDALPDPSESFVSGSGQDARPQMTNEQKNQRIREGYARNEPVADIAAATGLKKDAVKQRARTMKLGSRERQRQMARAYTTEQHRQRAQQREAAE